MRDISEELAETLKQERLQQYAVRIYQVKMDITAYKAVGDSERLALCEKALNSLIVSYQAIEAM